MYETMTAEQLVRLLGTPEEPFLLDVRSPEEFAGWAIPGAVNVPIEELGYRADEVPRDRSVVTVCGIGARSEIAARSLSAGGWSVTNLVGGMAGWSMVYDEAVVSSGPATIIQLRRRGKGCLSYVVGSGNEAFVIDPSTQVDLYVEVAARHGWKISRVFDTHLHADHLSGARQLADEVEASLHLNPFDTFHFPYDKLADGQQFRLAGGGELSVAAVHTPGHTEGSTIYFTGDTVLSGDTLFTDGVGRPDLADRAEEFARNLYRSLAEKVLTLADDVLVLPAHYGDGVTVRPDVPVGAPLGDLRRSIEALTFDEDTFVSWAASRATERPPNYVEIVHANIGRPRLAESALAQLEQGPNRCSA